MNGLELIEHLKTKNSDEQLHKLYPADETERQRIRYIDAINEFARLYPKRSELKIYSAPGRTEICGNHTDHQNGHILAASVDLDAIAVVAFHDEGGDMEAVLPERFRHLFPLNY